MRCCTLSRLYGALQRQAAAVHRPLATAEWQNAEAEVTQWHRWWATGVLSDEMIMCVLETSYMIWVILKSICSSIIIFSWSHQAESKFIPLISTRSCSGRMWQICSNCSRADYFYCQLITILFYFLLLSDFVFQSSWWYLVIYIKEKKQSRQCLAFYF